MDIVENEDVQFFKEDRQDDVISDVYLKKVLYHTEPDDASLPSSGDSPTNTNRSRFYVKHPDEDEGNKGRLQWRMVEMRVVRYATLQRLIEAFGNDEGEIDSTYVSIFLVTFRSFCTAREVLEEIIKRYVAVSSDGQMKQNKKDAILKTVRTVLMQWLDGYADDFDEPPYFYLLHQLLQFATSQLQHSEIIGKCQQLLDRFTNDSRPTYLETLLSQLSSVDDSCTDMELSDALIELTIPSDPLIAVYSLEDIPSRLIAQQLTHRDAELFKRLVPYQCLGSMWSRRNKRSREVATVIATVDFFNAVSYRVIATVLKQPELATKERARLIEKWIEVAHELRILKNFSSLKAVLSGLTYQAIHRLKQVWKEVDDWPMQVFQEMMDIFSDDNNQQMARELLMLEGTAKHADPESCDTIRQQKARRTWGTTKRKSNLFDMQSQTMQGTVPYLGTFLTDLTMIDTGMPDRTSEGLINFEKKRKEFEVIAQIKLLQSAANLYAIKYEPVFFDWFYSLRVYDDTESYELSCEIEQVPVAPVTPGEGRGHKKKPSLGFFSPKKHDSEATFTSLFAAHEREASDNISITSTSTCTYPASSSRSSKLRHSASITSVKSAGACDADSLSIKQDEIMVARVVLETTACHETNHYKSILLRNSDRTKVVIQNVLLKFNVEGNPDDYVIFQALPKKECQIPDKANVFYAVNRSVPEVKFVIRKKAELDKIKQKKRKESAATKKKDFIL